MDALAILAALRQRGIVIEARPGGRVRCLPAPPDELKTAILANKPALLAALGVGRPCYSCGTRRRWRVGVGPWRCPTCHPPHPELGALEWLDGGERPSWTVGAIHACVVCGRGTARYHPDGRPMHPDCGGGE